ncbi:MAG: AAA family ATPase [Phycisphaerae bacterium]|nr:AAA family ATPase [Phycisphaerae bacterium]
MHLFDIQPVADALASRAAEKQCLCVAIDGAGGSGKSTLARELAAATGATVVHGDDFYCVMDEAVRAALTPEQGYRRNFDWQRWRDQLLEPLSCGVAANYQVYDWERNVLGKCVRVNARGIILIEGVTSCRPELRDYYDVKIYVETPRDLCMARLRERGHGTPEEWLQRWAAAEVWYAANELDLDGFDVKFCGN